MPLGKGVPTKERAKEGHLCKKTLFCGYWLVFLENGCK